MPSYIRDNFERFGNYLSINVMKSSICNANELCYIDPVVLNEIGKINVVCEGFVITKDHDAYDFFLNPYSRYQHKGTRKNYLQYFLMNL